MKILKKLIILSILSTFFSSCNPYDSPVKVTEQLYDLIQSRNFSKTNEFLCQSKKDWFQKDLEEINNILDSNSISQNEYFNNFKIEIGNMQFKEIEKDEKKSKVAISGYFKYNVNEDFLFRFIKTHYTYTGDIMPDEDYKVLANNLLSLWKDSDKEIKSVEIDLVREDGKWLVCNGMLLYLQRIY